MKVRKKSSGNMEMPPGKMIDCMVFNDVFNSTTVISQWPVQSYPYF